MHLEMHLRGTYGARENKTEAEGGNYDHPIFCGRDQLSFRNNFPVKDLSGCLCEWRVEWACMANSAKEILSISTHLIF